MFFAIETLVACLVLASGLPHLAMVCQVGGTPRLDLDSVFANLENRARKVRTGKFAMLEEITIPKGALGLQAPPWVHRKTTGLLPPEDMINKSKVSVSFSDDSLRYGYDGPTWTYEAEQFVDQSYLSTFNGESAKSFYAKAYGEFPLGFVHKNKKSHMDADSLFIQPILRHFRGLHPSMGRFVRSKCVVPVQSIQMGGRRALVLEHIMSRSKETFWLDLERDFLILRSQRDYASGAAFEQIDISYILDKANGWVPSEWTGMSMYSFDNGKSLTLTKAFSTKVVSYELNTALPRNEFDLSFGLGTFVEDEILGHGYILRSNGEKRMVTPKERARRAKYEDLLNSESGMAGMPRVNDWPAKRI